MFFLTKFVQKFKYNLFLNTSLSVITASVSTLEVGVWPDFY